MNFGRIWNASSEVRAPMSNLELVQRVSPVIRSLLVQHAL
jgi:hypothetical protein